MGPGATVVETGWGTGEVTRQLRRLGLRVVATDLSVGMLRVARRRDPGAALAELRRVVRPGGTVLLGFHSGTGSHLKTEGYGGHPMRVHVHRRTALEVSERLRRRGFTVSSTTETSPAPGSTSGGAVVLATR